MNEISFDINTGNMAKSTMLAMMIRQFRKDFSYAPDDWVLSHKGTSAPSEKAQDRLNEICDLADEILNES